MESASHSAVRSPPGPSAQRAGGRGAKIVAKLAALMAAGAGCAVALTFVPTAPGQRDPAVLLAAEAGDLIGTAHYCRAHEVGGIAAEIEGALAARAANAAQQIAITHFRAAMVEAYTTAKMTRPDCRASSGRLAAFRAKLTAGSPAPNGA